MNKKFLTLLTTGALLVTSVAAAGCASKKTAMVTMTTPATQVQTSTTCTETTTQETPETSETIDIKPVSFTGKETAFTTPETVNAVTLNNTKANTGKTNKKVTKKTTKKSSKKTTQAVKKTTVKTVTKTSEPTKNTDATKSTDATKNTDSTKSTDATKNTDASKSTVATKNTDSTKQTKKTVTVKFAYGNSTYSYKNMAVNVYIKKDNTAEFQVVEFQHNNAEMQYEIYWFGKGTVDPETNTLTYKSSTKRMIVLTNTGNNTRMQYSNGSGTFKFGKNSLKWNDQLDHKGNNYKFVKQ